MDELEKVCVKPRLTDSPMEVVETVVGYPCRSMSVTTRADVAVTSTCVLVTNTFILCDRSKRFKATLLELPGVLACTYPSTSATAEGLLSSNIGLRKSVRSSVGLSNVVPALNLPVAYTLAA